MIPAGDPLDTATLTISPMGPTEIDSSMVIGDEYVDIGINTDSATPGEYLLAVFGTTVGGYVANQYLTLLLIANPTIDPLEAALVKKYVAYITQSGTAAPVAVIGYNNLPGVPTWSRVGVGVYRVTLITLTGVFTVNKTFPSPDLQVGFVGNEAFASAERIDNDIIEVRIVDFGNNPLDGFEMNFEIEVYA